jgi:hypothetical protein
VGSSLREDKGAEVELRQSDCKSCSWVTLGQVSTINFGVNFCPHHDRNQEYTHYHGRRPSQLTQAPALTFVSTCGINPGISLAYRTLSRLYLPRAQARQHDSNTNLNYRHEYLHNNRQTASAEYVWVLPVWYACGCGDQCKTEAQYVDFPFPFPLRPLPSFQYPRKSHAHRPPRNFKNKHTL